MDKIEKALLAGGCFWGIEYFILKLKGVVETKVGYAGGILENPTYEDVKTGKTGHKESVLIKFNLEILSYDNLLDYFFSIHDPTTLNRQINDIGSQYSSFIFYFNEEQKQKALEAKIRAKSKWKKEIVTEIVSFKNFWEAETYHQKYLEKNPKGYNCHFIRKF